MQYQDDSDDLAERPNKSQLKREMHELQDLGAELVKLPPDKLISLELPEKLTDALVDGAIDRGVFQHKQDALLLDQTRIKEKVVEIEKGACAALASIEKTVELAKDPSILYKGARPGSCRTSPCQKKM